MWEDANNVEGGRWLVVVDKQKRTQLLDHYWLELLMAMIGEQFEEHSDQICGAVVNVRQKGDKVGVLSHWVEWKKKKCLKKKQNLFVWLSTRALQVLVLRKFRPFFTFSIRCLS